MASHADGPRGPPLAFLILPVLGCLAGVFVATRFSSEGAEGRYVAKRTAVQIARPQPLRVRPYVNSFV